MAIHQIVVTYLFSPLSFSLCTGLNSSEVRPTGKAPNVSINWSCGDGGLEEISTSTGRRKDSGTPSQLCKRSMFARWQRLQQQVGPRHSETGNTEPPQEEGRLAEKWLVYLSKVCRTLLVVYHFHIVVLLPTNLTF